MHWTALSEFPPDIEMRASLLLSPACPLPWFHIRAPSAVVSHRIAGSRPRFANTVRSAPSKGILEHVQVIDGTEPRGGRGSKKKTIFIEGWQDYADIAGAEHLQRGNTVLNLRGYSAHAGIVCMHEHSLLYRAAKSRIRRVSDGLPFSPDEVSRGPHSLYLSREMGGNHRCAHCGQCRIIIRT